MYIKIGKTNIKYSSGVDDYMIFSEVPDSQLSYEKPVLVRTKDELDIWFGKDFSSRDYFDELIKRGVTLYLYKPIKENNTNDIDDYIDIETYYIFPEIFYSLPETGEEGYTYYLQVIDPLKHYYRYKTEIGDDQYEWVPADSIDRYSIYPRPISSIYDLPDIGEAGYVYYVENLPECRYWHVFEDGEWREAEDYKNYIPYKKFYSLNESLPESGVYKYFVIFDMSWYIWKDNKWTKTTNDDKTQEFPIHFDTLDDIPSPGDHFKYCVNDVWYIWLGDSWTPENIFPQNLDNLSESLNNRDTLRISKPNPNLDEEGDYVPYSYPEFRLFNGNHLGVFSRDYDIDYSKLIPLDNDDLSYINLGYKTMALRLLYTSEELDNGYIIIKSQVDEENYCFSHGGNIPGGKYFSGSPISVNTVEDLIDNYIQLGYKAEKIGDSEYLIYSSNIFDFTEFYTYRNITLKNSFEDTHNILSKYINDSKVSLEFYSKTIGTNYIDSENNIDSLISIKVEESDYERYRVTVSRYDYSEVFEGPIFSYEGKERLDNIINNNSKLVISNLSNLKNYIRTTTYSGIVSDSNLECQDFNLHFRIKDVHYYIPPYGEENHKYLVTPGLWAVWDSTNQEWIYISEDADDFYDYEEIILNYPNYSDLPVSGSSKFRYYVESEEKWYTWNETDEWTILTNIIIGEKYVVSIEKLEYEKYAIHVVVGSLSETFIGYLFDLEKDICTNSELFDVFKFKDLCNKLRVGSYYLRRGKNESQTRDMYIRSLSCLFDTQVDNVFPDFFLVPDITKYINELGKTDNSYSEYKDIFLEHAKNFNCQFLIQNNPPKYGFVDIRSLEEVNSFEDIENPEEGVIYFDGTNYKVLKDTNIPLSDQENFTDYNEIEISMRGGDFIYNYTEDISNYLVYFFKPLTILGHLRPAYYIFLEGLLRNVYSLTETIVNYDSPIEFDPYELENDVKDFSETLEKYKSNFMINNNHIYYYKKYFNGDKYESTVWMRFVLGKIYRELYKNKWSYLAKKSMGIIENNVRNTLERIENRFSIVNLIQIVRFNPNMSKNYLELVIDTYVNDLLNNNMTIDITVNYNELNTE